MTWVAVLALAGCSDGPAGGDGSGASDTDPGADSTGTSSDETDADETGADDTTEGSTGETEPEVEYLAPDEHLVRISMALRGTRPSVADLDAVRQDPGLIPDFVDEYMQGAGFRETVRDLHNDALLTNVAGQLPALAPLEGIQPFAISDSVMGTALRLIERIVVEDRPYSEIVTADTWVVDDIAAGVYGIEDDGSGWREVPIPGDRPAAGILSDNAFFLRHESANSNFHRGRANAVSTALLCLDYEDNNIELDEGIDLTDVDAVATALTTNPACLACHDTLDPLASHFFAIVGNPMNNQIIEYPLPDLYVSEREDDWMGSTGQAPGFYGETSSDIGSLGALISTDPRFTACTARRFYAYFLRTDLAEVPADTVDTLDAVFLESDLQAKALIRAIMLSDDFRVAAASSKESADQVQGYLRARPFQLARTVEDLTGFRWELDVQLLQPGTSAGVLDLVRSSSIGFQVLGGSGDSFTVLGSIDTTNATTSLFQRQLAAEASSFVVEQDAVAAQPRLLSAGLVTDEQAVRAQLVALFNRIHGEAAEEDSEDVDDAWALFDAAMAASGDPARAWKTTLTAMFRDLGILFY